MFLTQNIFLFCRFSFLSCMKKCFCRRLRFCWFCSFRFTAPVPKETSKSTKPETTAICFFMKLKNEKRQNKKCSERVCCVYCLCFWFLIFPTNISKALAFVSFGLIFRLLREFCNKRDRHNTPIIFRCLVRSLIECPSEWAWNSNVVSVDWLRGMVLANLSNLLQDTRGVPVDVIIGIYNHNT